MGSVYASDTENSRVHVGQHAPDFTLLDQSGTEHRLTASRGRWVLVYFYPKDDTPGCTKEACGIRDRFAEFRKRQVVVFGISADSVASHQRFARKFQLPFPLLADTQKSVAQAYGVWGQQQVMGKTYVGIRRTSFLIDPAGKIAKIYPTVNPEEHPEQILRDLTQLRVKD